jgi:ribosomal protein L1
LVTHLDSLEIKVSETKATVKFQLKKVLCIGVPVGKLSMEEKQIQKNIQMSVYFLAEKELAERVRYILNFPLFCSVFII